MTAAQRLTPQQWAGVEEQMAAKAACYMPSELQAWGTALVELLDQDGAEPDDRPAAQINELYSTDWVVRIRDGLPEFIPPRFVDPHRTPRRKALPHLAGLRQ
jgi:hypothetical protein